jgi:exopolysaccharide biosynthesis predicted pyruvyltransferase EpsI
MEATRNADLILIGKLLGLVSFAGGGDMGELYLQSSW